MNIASLAHVPDFKAIFEASPHLLAVFTPDLRIAAVNDAYCRVIGQERSLLIGQSVYELAHGQGASADELNKQLRDSLTRVLQFRRPDRMPLQRYAIQNAQDETLYYLATNTPVVDGQGTVAWIIYRAEDATERVRLADMNEKALRQRVQDQQLLIEQLQSTSHFLDALIEHLPGTLFVKSAPELRFISVNRSWEEITGISRAQVLGKTDYDFFPKDEADAFTQRDRQVLESGETVFTPVEKVTSKFKGTRYFRTTKVPVKGPGGAVQYLLAVAEDITDQKMVEQQLRQAVKMEAVGQLTGGIAHDFNNLLGVVIGNLDIVAEKADLPEDVLECVNGALSGALRGAELTRRLLVFSRHQPLQTSTVDLNKSLGQSASMLRRTLGGNILVEFHQAVGLWQARVDPAQLDEALLNIGINARDAMPQGGLITIETSNIHVDEVYAAQRTGLRVGDYVLISVRDTGVGMAPEIIDRCFEPFFTTKEIEKGTGLGLSMVYGFVKQSGGCIGIESEPGHGTDITVYLPRASQGAVGSGLARVAAPLPRADNELVLVVEDNQELRALTCRYLKEAGYRVVEADNGRCAMKMLGETPNIDLVFSDVMMPQGLNGLELAVFVRDTYPNTRILLTTGYAGRIAAAFAEDSPDFEMLDKPFRREDLIRRVHDVLHPACDFPL